MTLLVITGCIPEDDSSQSEHLWMQAVIDLTKTNLTKHVHSFINQKIKASDFRGLDDALLNRMHFSVADRQTLIGVLGADAISMLCPHRTIKLHISLKRTERRANRQVERGGDHRG